MSTLEDYFSIKTFLIVFRESLETAIIISVLLSFLHQTFKSTEEGANEVPADTSNHLYEAITNEPVSSSNEIKKDDELYRNLQMQIWIGGSLGLLVCMLVGCVILGIFYIVGKDLWTIAEHYWEGTFSILASIIISVMGIKILRVSKMQKKWKFKLGQALKQSKHFGGTQDQSNHGESTTSWMDKIKALLEKYNMLILPFVTTLREGLEAIVFIGGIGINEETSMWAIANSAISAIIMGFLVGFVLYRSGNTLSLQWFLVISTCFLYLVAAGLFSKGVWNFELQQFINQCGGLDVSETGHGPGSYDIAKSVWHVNCCNGELQEDGALWMILAAVFGWTNSATYGSVIGYNVYWIIVIITYTSLLFEEKNGYLPIVPISWQLQRITKRSNLYKPLDRSEVVEGNDELQRQSLESVDSGTPLQRSF
ncbi:FTH1 [Candida oxycetoniae]|uniref:FTH1 n=1 Tax=Candida oxycetoniae TaxID=497107 RepID=A0AAI9SZC9_9ASCO|nr:FTH1 [Candida oxycetoniae]KAI3405749.2 FTH1 [Candida oxycetoniae]